ncbi:MAG: type I-E CRISPR-associated protein Cse2/CasB [Clostridiaceae bacterium]
MGEISKSESVYDVTLRIISKMSNSLELSSTKAMLSKLRNSIGHNESQTIEIWKEVFPELPESFLSRDGNLTKEERSILTALQLYAMHQQGKPKSVNLSFKLEDLKSNEEIKSKDDESKTKSIRYFNIGDSLSKLREAGESSSIDSRFNAMITASSINEFTNHLRHLLSIFKSKEESKVNYAKLAEDLMWYQIGKQEQVRLLWGQGYYSKKKLSEKEEQ